MNSDDPKVEKVLTHFEALSTVASSLNAASDELTQVVGIIDEALKKLNIGLTVWVPFRFRGDDELPTEYDQDEIGYAKVESNWGLALRRIYGDEERDYHHEIGPWLFNDAPRDMRLAAVDQISALIEALSKEASNTTKRVQEKVKQVRELASAVKNISNEPKTKTLTLTERIVLGKALEASAKGLPAEPAVHVTTLGTSPNKGRK
jgi:methyl-accepting chemotaxis protein